MKLHWKILAWLVAGGVLGGVFQKVLEAPPWIGVTFEAVPDGVRVVSLDPGSPAGKSRPGADAALSVGQVVRALVQYPGDPDRERRHPVRTPEEAAAALAQASPGDLVWWEGDADLAPVSVAMEPGCERDRWLMPFRFAADLFMALLKMLIVPVILTSIISGVAGVGSGRDFGRMGLKTFAYYVSTSLLAIFLGLLLVNVIRPGHGAALGLKPEVGRGDFADQSLFDIFRRMVPENIFSAFNDNSQMLQVIFFALLFGFFIIKTAEPHRTRVREFFQSAFEVMMALAGFVLGLIPYGVFALLVKVVGETGFGMFRALGAYMLTVALGLVLHATVTLPTLLRVFGKVSPVRWVKAVGPALMTAFSTSSSSMTLPVTLEAVEERGKVSNKTTSFVLPLGATINMDGTALYECVGVIFLAQYYSSVGDFTLSIMAQVTVVLTALLASIGAAGIPSAGLVMMLTILSGLGLPLEGAALLLAVDRPLDMMRTVVNVWSDTCGAAIVAHSEGETGLAAIPGSAVPGD